VSVHGDAFVHESAYVDEGATIGAGTKVWHFCHVLPGAVIGARSSLGQNVVVMNGVKIGNNVKIQNNVSVYEGVELEDDVFCGPSMVFTNVINPRSHVSRKTEYRRTLVRRGATIGANATIVCGATLGEYAFVGAGAVVSKDVPAYALMLGVPARRAGWMCQCGERLPDSGSGRCAACGSVYESDGDSIRRVSGPANVVTESSA
jgi:UDP-2-acetamido-3-amino-2,3-dideoxy-glucuronate N-acetyltransferase